MFITLECIFTILLLWQIFNIPLDNQLFPKALEPRICTRWDMHKYARDAYELGVRYIGGCCGFEPYHIRAVAEEVRN